MRRLYLATRSPRAGAPDFRWPLPVPTVRSAMKVRPFGRLCWLPAGGRGNGLDDDAWAPVLEISAAAVPSVLAALGSASVPAYAARRGSGAGTGPRSRPCSAAAPAASTSTGTYCITLTTLPFTSKFVNGRVSRPFLNSEHPTGI